MYDSMQRPEEPPSPEQAPEPIRIQALMSTLHDRNGLERLRARSELVEIGRAAVPALIAGLHDPEPRARWEAAKALGDICMPAAAEALVAALEDEDTSVRWAAAESLVALGPASLPALLDALEKHSESFLLQHGAHYVLRNLATGDVQTLLEPVLEALRGVEPAVQAPAAAKKALEALPPAEDDCLAG
jgi:HEAT repeat protein